MSFISELSRAESPRKFNTRIFGVLAVFLCLTGFLAGIRLETTDPVSSQLSSEAIYTAAAALSGTENGPGNGTVFYRKYDRNPASLHIINQAVSDVCVSLSDGLFHKSVLDFYLCAGQELLIDTPVGYFELHISTGSRWENSASLFGPETLRFTDPSEHGQELGRKAICEFTISPGFTNLIPEE